MTFAIFTFLAGIVVGAIAGYFVASSRLETKFIQGVASLKEEVDLLKEEMRILRNTLLESEEERKKLLKFNVLVPEIVRKFTTNVIPEDIPFVAVRSLKSFFNANCVSYFTPDGDETFVMVMGTGYPPELNGNVRVKVGEGIIGLALEHRKTLNMEDFVDMERHSRVTISEFEKSGLKAEIVAPIIGLDGIYGIIAVSEMSFLVPESKRYMSMIGDIIALAYDKARVLVGDGENSVKDDLSDIYNRSYFARRFVSEIRKAENYLLPLSLLMLEIDDLPSIIDRYGRDTGDLIIKSVGEITRNKTRRADFVARYEEGKFVVVMIASTKEQAYIHGRRLCEEVSETSFPLPDKGEEIFISLSGGVAGYMEDGSHPSDLIKAAEDALTDARAEGGNRVLKREVKKLRDEVHIADG